MSETTTPTANPKPEIPAFTKKQLVRCASEFYPDGLVWMASRLKPGAVGDSMADFIANEISDTFDDTLSPELRFITAAKYLANGKRELDQVIAGLVQTAVTITTCQFLAWLIKQREPLAREVYQAWARCNMAVEMRESDRVRHNLELLFQGWETNAVFDPAILQKVLEKLVADLKIVADGNPPSEKT